MTHNPLVELHQAFIFVTEVDGYFKNSQKPIPNKNELRIILADAKAEVESALMQNGRTHDSWVLKELTSFGSLVRFFVGTQEFPSGNDSFMRIWRLAVNFSAAIEA